MAETFGSFSTPSAGSAGQKPHSTREPFKFDWRLFWIYGAFWCAIFFGIVCVQKAGYFVYDQHRRIQDLIDRIHQYENPDFFDRDDVSPDENDADSSLSVWVKKNLPAKGVEERPAVAEVFLDLAEKLDNGTLKGEKDAFSEGIAQLQPVATRSIWLNFLTKLTKKLHAAKLDSNRLAEAFRVIAKAIYPASSRASVLLLEAVTPPNPPDTPETEPSPAPPEGENPSLVKPAETAGEDSPEPSETGTESSAKESKSCPTGTCPANTATGNYRWF